MPRIPVADLVASAKAEIRTIPLGRAREMAEAGEAQLVDIRDIRELKKTGRIPGAVHAPRGMLEFWIDPESPYHREELATDRTLVLFCAGAQRSALAVKTLNDMGFDNVVEMEGGFTAWEQTGMPVEKD
ncbi:rhodanese-related sulfurtransferase [Palleronia aestuarii]|uniref:Rhodanese-related sulfurtransferase n=1 Tax=Palleronia aestuarii TaxID=568105 RepID=A0A2W7P5Z9_9RHOB|nr:rhodanese-like domain-containing protein [Palleronia aestuarii]PZX18832.1 rhodanese-related sulfurtransferase [Palleronia aestuarii]